MIVRFFAAMRNRGPLSLTLLSGTLALAAFYVPHVWWLAFVALVPFFYALRNARGPWHAFALGTLMGVFLAGGTTLWFFAALPLPPISGVPGLQFLLILISWLIMLALMAPCVGAFAVLALLARPSTWSGAVLLGAAWVALEWLRMYAFAIASYAPQVNNPPFFSVGFLGYPLADSLSYLQLASLGGVYLMSFAAIAANLAFYRLSLLPRRAAMRGSILFASALALVAFVPVADLRDTTPASGRTLTVALLSSYLPPETRIGPYKLSTAYKGKVEAFVAQMAPLRPDVILLPEGSGFLADDVDGAPLAGTPVVIDSFVTHNFGDVVAGYAGTPDTSTHTAIRSKRILTPQGEYLIGAFGFGGSLLGYGDLMRAVALDFRIRSESWGGALELPSGARASVMFCVEMIAPGLGKELVRNEGSDAILFMLSHGTFRPAHALRTDTLRFLKVQAVEAGVPLAASGDEVLAYAIDRYGRVLAAFGANLTDESGIVGLPLAAQ